MPFDSIVWLVLLVGLLIVEASCPCHLVSIWFAVGSLAAFIASLLSAPLWLQIALFMVVSGSLLALMWPLVKKFLTPKVEKTNIDSVIGSTGRVTAAINNVDASGQVKLGAMYWTARSTSGEVIPEGTLIRVDRIEGVKVFVSVVEEPAKI